MKDRSTLGASLVPALIAAGFVLVGGMGAARAEQPSGPADDAPVEAVPAAPAPASVAAPTPLPAAQDQTVAAPAAALATAPAAETSPASWFARPSLTVVAGEGNKQFKLTLFGFVEVDYIFDTTRSYNDAMGSAIVARTDTHDGNSSRSQFSMRNSRLGFAFESPTLGTVKPTAVLEADFFGHQDSPPTSSEGTFFNSPTFRVRHAYVKLKSPYVDFLMGQSYDLFGWQNYYYPCSLEFLGIPNQLFSRNPQLRLSRLFNAEGAIAVDVAASAGRPAQRDSQVPDGSAGLRIVLNKWKGIVTPGNVGTTAQPASIGVSGIVRQFKVNAFAPPPTRNSNSATGWGMSVDALVPVIAAGHAGDRSNRLTLTGSFVKGTGIADLITSGGGAKFPTLPNPAQAIPAPIYDADIDPSLVTFDANGVVHTLDWTAFRVGLQYYLPPTGRLLFSANYTQSHSPNMSKFYTKGGSTIELLSTIADTSRYVDANLMWDATPSLRLGLSGQYTQVEYLDGNKPHNVRGMGQSVYVF
jgi:hypothetical protein